jgi:hypothetical protein
VVSAPDMTFWDLTMQQIKKWYKHSDDEPLKHLLNPDGDNIKFN